MNARERLLLIVLVTVVGGGALVFGTIQWFIKPMHELSKQITEASLKRDEAQLVLDQYFEDMPKLKRARERSLPADQADAGFEYMTVYLKPKVLNPVGLKDKDVNVSHSHATDMRFNSSVPGIKKVGHQVMTFNVRAKGDLNQLVSVMEKLQRTPYEHRIRGFTIDRADLAPMSKDLNPKLNFNLTIEALLVAKAERKSGGAPPAFEESSETRRYADIASRNVFAGEIPGYLPPPKKKQEPKKSEPRPEPKPSLDVPQYIRLIHVEVYQKTAYLRNRVYREPERKLIAKANSGYDTFRVVDEDTGIVFFKAKVLRIDSRSVFFQVKDEVYEVQMGMSLAEAMEEPLTEDEIEELELSALYDEDWANDMDPGKKKKTGTTPKKGSKSK